LINGWSGLQYLSELLMSVFVPKGPADQSGRCPLLEGNAEVALSAGQDRF